MNTKRYKPRSNSRVYFRELNIRCSPEVLRRTRGLAKASGVSLKAAYKAVLASMEIEAVYK